jgi:hypothetical protein
VAYLQKAIENTAFPDEQERHELQQFLYTLREQCAAAPKESPQEPPTHRNSSGSAVEVKMCRVR